MKKIFAVVAVLSAVLIGCQQRTATDAPAPAGYDEGVAAFNRGDYATALKEFQPLAEQGYADAQYNLGSMHGNGQGVPRDYAEAAKWWRKAAEQDNANAQYGLGVSYHYGYGVPQDYVRAQMWLNLAVAKHNNQGSPHKYLHQAISALTANIEKMTRAQLAEGQRLAHEWAAIRAVSS